MKITRSFIPTQNPNRPAKKMNPTFITMHETGNYAKGANAKAHSSFLRTTSSKVSWHYSVDEKEIYQHLPDTEVAYHAGTTKGNTRSIGIEICVNSDGNFNDACTNAIWLVRKLMSEHHIPIENVVQHNYWNGKNCPENLRVNGWGDFIKECARSDDELTKEEVLELINANKEKVYHFWKELPKWALPPIQAMYNRGYFTGASPSDLNLSQTKMECLVIIARALKQEGLINY